MVKVTALWKQFEVIQYIRDPIDFFSRINKSKKLL
jgi:hypothetical protein